MRRPLVAPWLITLLLAALLSPAWAEPSLTTMAEQLDNGRPQEALATAQKLRKSGQTSFGLAYNEGLAWRDLGDPARARAAFEQALWLNPRHLATRRHLQELRLQLGLPSLTDEVRGTPWWRQNEVEVALCLPGLALWLLVLGARRRGTAVSTRAALSLLALGGALALGVLLSAPPARRAVVVEKGVQRLPRPSPEQPGKEIPMGQMVQVLEARGHYVQVRSGDGQTGWVRQPQVVEFTLPD